MHKYKVTLQRPFKTDKTTAVIHAHTAADACTQAEVHFGDDRELRVTGVEPTADPGGDDPDRIKFRADLAAAVPPMGTQEVKRLQGVINSQNRLINTVNSQVDDLCRAVYPEKRLGSREHLIADSLARIDQLRQRDALAEPMDKQLADQQRHIESLVANEKQLATEIQHMDGGAPQEAVRQLKALCVAITGEHKDYVDTSVQQALTQIREWRDLDKQLTRMNSLLSGTQNQVEDAWRNLAKVCVAIYPGCADEDKESWVEIAVSEAERLRKKGTTVNADLVEAREELDQALKNLAKVCVAINPESDKDKGTWVDQAVDRASRFHQAAKDFETINKYLREVCAAVLGVPSQGGTHGEFADAMAEIDRLKIRDAWVEEEDLTNVNSRLIATQGKFEAALEVIEAFERPGSNVDEVVVRVEKVCRKFRTLHPKE